MAEQFASIKNVGSTSGFKARVYVVDGKTGNLVSRELQPPSEIINQRLIVPQGRHFISSNDAQATNKQTRDVKPPSIAAGISVGSNRSPDEERRPGVASRKTGGDSLLGEHGNVKQLGASDQGRCQKCYGSCRGLCERCGNIPRWLWILIALLALIGIILGVIFGLKYIHAKGLPAGYECPDGYFVNARKCIACPQNSKWNGTNCLKEDNSTMNYTETSPVKIDPTIQKYITTKINATGQDQCAPGEVYYEGKCLKCPQGFAWNGTHCRIIDKPSNTTTIATITTTKIAPVNETIPTVIPNVTTTTTTTITATSESNPTNNTNSTTTTNSSASNEMQNVTVQNKPVCKEGEFILNGKCMKCPDNTTWDGTHCIKKVIVTQEERLAPIAAHDNIAVAHTSQPSNSHKRLVHLRQPVTAQ